MKNFCSEEMINKLKRFIVRQRIFFMRGGGIITTPTLAYVAASTLQIQLNDRGIHISLWIMLPIAAIIIWILGIIEYRMKLYQYEMEFNWNINPGVQALKDHITGEIHKSKDNRK